MLSANLFFGQRVPDASESDRLEIFAVGCGKFFNTKVLSIHHRLERYFQLDECLFGVLYDSVPVEEYPYDLWELHAI